MQFSEGALQLISSYLNNRTQSFKVGTSRSTFLSITRGVPQGSILGPILFILAINDIFHKFPTAYAYADDTVVYTTASDINSTIAEANTLLGLINNWYSRNSLQLNLSKTQFVVLSNRQSFGACKLSIGSHTIQSVDSIKLLGTELDHKLTFSNHVKRMVNKTTGLLHLLGKLRKYLNVEQALQTYKSIIKPHLEYCPSLLLNLCSKYSNQLEQVQNNAIRLILKAPSKFSVTTGRQLLNLHTLKSRRYFLFHKFIQHKYSQGKASKHLLNLHSTSQTHQRHLRSQHLLIKPYYRTNHGKASFLTHLHTTLQSLKTPAKAKLSFTL